MSCASCDQSRRDGLRRCPVCGGLLVPPVEGALAPDPSAAEVVRELPGWRRRERAPSWQDEVRDRVRRRRRQRVKDASLPLFPDPPEDEGGVAEATSPPNEEPATDVVAAPPLEVERPVSAPPPAAATAAEPEEAMIETPDGGSEPLQDAPAPASPDEDAVEPFAADSPEEDAPVVPSQPLSALDDRLSEARLGRMSKPDLDFVAPEVPETAAGADADGTADPSEPPSWSFSLPSSPASERPLERPAQAMERAQAAVLDLGLLVAGWLVVVYFASRVAGVPMDALSAAWPYVTGFLLFIGLAYATYFTSATGQTLGKQVVGLRVLGPGSRPPDAWRALGRALLGVIGLLALGAGFIPLLFDPARRGLHDRIAGTRVVRR